MKAIGVNIILAQCGLYVPCKHMEYTPYKAVFTRITGNDNIFKGLSSFSLEMVELNNIIKYANRNSLVIGDEICKGTEPISACSIVSSILLILAQRRCSFIFASHLHDLVKINDINNLKNMSIYHLKIRIDEDNEKLIYDRQLEVGSGENIYGVTVAKFVIKDKEFIRLADKMVEIHKQLYNQGHENGDDIKLKIVEDKKSKYNSKKFISKCENCGKKASYKGELQTHHNIIHQEECDNMGYLEHLHKNSLWNLQALCTKCHDFIHNDLNK
jgi:DNA mismatch repair protein MutS